MKNQDSILDIINNIDNLYDGDLKHYFKLIFEAPNVNNPYHNFRHMMHVMWECFDATRFYKLDKRESRTLLISAMFHDFGHKGTISNDKQNIETSLRAVSKYLLEEDKDLLYDIKELISATEFPYTNQELSQNAQILRDADMSQIFSDSWLQQVIFGLALESQITPTDLLKQQLEFIPNIKFNTGWATEKFATQKEVRLKEVKELLNILEN